jgi:mannosyl-3-phosphoglycerate phosphatase
MGEARKLVIFTDLDGTLLDLKTYSHLPALEALSRIIEAKIPLVFCSSKTRAEQQHYQELIGIREPMIVENGSAIFIPQNYFSSPFQSRRTKEGYDVIEAGDSAEKIKNLIAAVRRQTGARLRSFGEMSLEELCRATDLSREDALRAQRREYSETILSEMTDEESVSFIETLRSRGLSCIRGSRFHTVVSAGVDKGKAVDLLTGLFRKEMKYAQLVGIGDSANDEAMLAAVDLPFLLQRPDGSHEDMNINRLKTVDGTGPVAWNRLVCQLLDESSSTIAMNIENEPGQRAP